MKFSVFQFHLSRDAVNAVNSVGWTEAQKQYPEVAIQRDVMGLGGYEGWQSWMADFYTKVAVASGVWSLSELFNVGNGYGDTEKMTRVADRMHSLSVGDLVYCHDTGLWFMCEPEGWTGISVNIPGIIDR